MALDYTYLKYKEEHTLTNNSVTPLTYTVFLVTCTEEKEITQGILIEDTTVPIVFKFDGEYEIRLDDGEFQETISIKSYLNLLKNFIEGVENTICGCEKCNDCEECTECVDILEALTLGYSYKIINNTIFNATVPFIEDFFFCDFSENVACNNLNKLIHGDIDTEILKKIISFYYLSFYFQSLNTAIDVEEKEFYTVLYKYSKILKCIKKLGLNVTGIEEAYQEGLDTQITPNHTSKIFYTVDFESGAAIPKSLLLLNYEEVNGNPASHIIFYNSATLGAVLTTTGGTPIVDNVEYPISSFSDLYNPIPYFSSPNPEAVYPNCPLYIISGTSDETIKFGLRNAQSPIFNDRGEIIISII